MASKSEQAWLQDLSALLLHARARFGDVSWVSQDRTTTIYAHKCIIFARSSGTFQQRYLLAQPSNDTNDSSLSLPFQQSTTRRSVTPNSAAHDYSDPNQFMRAPSPASMASFNSSTPSAPLPLVGTDPAVFRACLEHFYSGVEHSFTVLFEGFEEGVGDRQGEQELKGVDKLRADCLFMWRSRLYADATISLDDGQGSVFSVHRAVLASRSPYFKSLLLGSFSDSRQSHFTLPSPPFTSASTFFVLGYIYSGTLSFGNRSLDLSTTLEVWRCAAYLQLANLQEEVEAKVETMMNLARAARIYSFALAPDVSSQRLARAASPLVLSNFPEVWNSKEIGNLEYEAQKKLVSGVCATITPVTLTTIGKGSFVLQKRLELEKAAWASHVRSMLDAIDERLKAQLGKALTEVVATPGFVELIDGIGFSSDVLEYLLEMAVGSLTEAKAPEAYQALVGAVLLREEGILMDAKVLVEDAKNGILKYIKRRWSAIKLARGFDNLETWALKELADELEVAPGELISSLPANARPTARSTPRRLAAASASSAVLARKSSPGPGTWTPAPVDPPRALRLSTVSTASRAALRSTSGPQPAATGSSPAPKVTATLRPTSAPRPTPATRQEPSASSATSARTPTPSRPVVAPLPPVTTSTSATPRPMTTSDAASTTSPPRPSRAPPAAPVEPSGPVASSSTAAPKPFRAATVSTTNGATARAVATKPRQSITRRPPSLAPSVASERSASSTSSSKPRSPVVPRTPITSRPPPSARGGSAQASAATVKGKAPAVSTPTSANKTVKRPGSAASTATTTPDGLRRPASTASLRSVSSVRAPAAPSPAIKRPASSTSIKSLAKPVSKVHPRSSSAAASVANNEHTSPRPPLPNTGPGGTPTLPGTTLLSGIPCIVTVTADKETRFRATVRYIGGVLWTDGQWIGIEVADSAIPDEARDLDWNDGVVEGQRYFQISEAPAPRSTSNGRSTPQVTELPDGRSGASSSSLRPPSRRARRSSSSEAIESGPRRALFVRPHQIVYIL